MVYKVGKKVKQDKKVVRRYLAGIAASLTIVAGAAVPALAASTSCNAGHGAPGGLGKFSPYDGGIQGEVNDKNTLPNGAIAPSAGSQFGQEQGADTTGLNNSSLAAYCRQ
jgi:hypothetical protein